MAQHMNNNDSNHSTLVRFAFVAALSLSATLLNAAEPPKDLQPLEELPPPAMSKDGENVDEPEVTIVKKNGDTIEEYRINGQLYMMKVTPKSGVPYYLHKEDQDGGWINDGPNKPLVIPKWTVFRF